MRRALRYLGFLAAAAFISWVLLRNFREIPAIDLHSVSAWGALTAALALYLAILLVAGLGWRLLQQSYGQSPGLLQAQSQLLIAQFGKYLPGNFAHFLGRIGLAVQDGASATGSGLALIAETALTILAGIAVAIAGLWLMPELRTTLGATMPQRPRSCYRGGGGAGGGRSGTVGGLFIAPFAGGCCAPALARCAGAVCGGFSGLCRKFCAAGPFAVVDRQSGGAE